MNGCQKNAPSAPVPSPPASTAPTAAGLLGAEFELVSFTLNGQTRPVAPSRPPTIAFPEQGRVAGFGGVNRYTGSCSLDGNVLTINPQIAMTMMAGPPEAMALEGDFGKALPGKHTVSLQGPLLRLESGANRLEFRKK